MALTEAEELELLELEEEEARLAAKPQGLMSRIGQDVQKREAMAQDIMANYQAGKISKPEEMFQLAGKAGAGVIGDISGQVLKSGIDVAKGLDYATGGYGSAGLSGISSAIGGLPSMGGGTIGERLPQEMAGLAQGYQQFAEQNPRLATNLEAGANLAMTIPAMTKAAEPVFKSAQDLLKSPLKRSQLAKLTSDDLRQRGGELFKLAEQQGGIAKPQLYNDFLREVQKITPQTAQGAALAGDNATTKAANAMWQFRGQPLTFEAAKEMDEALGEIAYGTMDNFGKLTADGKRVLDMQNILRSKMESAPDTMFVGGKKAFETVKEARKYWSASLRLRDIERIVQKAESGEQPATVIKNGFKQILNDGRKLKGYTPQEIDAIKQAAKTGVVGQALKLGGSGLVPIMAGVGGATATGGMAGSLAAIPALGVQQASKAGGVALQTARANEVSNLLKARALGQELPQTMAGAVGNIALQTGRAGLPAGAAYLASEQQRQQGPLTQRVMALIERRKMKQEQQ